MLHSPEAVGRLAGCGLAVLLLVGPADCGRRTPPPTWTDPATGMEFILVQPGTFDMGTPAGEPGREEQERRHRVTLSRPFYLGRVEVTQEQWTAVMGANPSQFPDCGGRCPVETINYHDVRRFIAALDAASRPGFRLPSEAEWEYACRAGGQAAFGWRDHLTPADANVDGRFPLRGRPGLFRGSPVPVGSFAANPWGLYDMAGNVWEWTVDRYCPYPAGDVTDPVGACGSDLQVIRGGSWRFDVGSARCGLRYTHRPTDSGYSLGVRLAHDVW